MAVKKTRNHGGKRAGAGRPPKVDPAEIQALFDAAWPYDERVKVITGLNKKAKQGDAKAASLLLAYAYGRPKEQIEHSGAIETAAPMLNVIISNGNTD